MAATKPVAATRSARSAPTKLAPTKLAPTKLAPTRLAPSSRTPSSQTPSGARRAVVVDGHNEVVLGGRVSGEPSVRVLPSGDELVSWRVVVGRDNRGVSANGRQLPTVDTIDCVAFKVGARRAASRLTGGEVVEIRGELRRRFWRGAQGAASRCEVEVLEIKKIRATQ